MNVCKLQTRVLKTATAVQRNPMFNVSTRLGQYQAPRSFRVSAHIRNRNTRPRPLTKLVQVNGTSRETRVHFCRLACAAGATEDWCPGYKCHTAVVGLSIE